MSRIAVAGLVVALGAPAVAQPAATGSIEVTITGFRHDEGRALVALFRSGAGFPDRGESAAQRVEMPIRGGRARVRFDGVTPGPFAVSVLHDEDGDFRMATGAFGIPQEGYGVSRDAVRRFGPPRFEEAGLLLAAGEQARITIRMHY